MVAKIKTREGGVTNLNDEDVANKTFQHNFGESITVGTKLVMFGQGLVASKAMACTLVLPLLPVVNLDTL